MFIWPTKHVTSLTLSYKQTVTANGIVAIAQIHRRTINVYSFLRAVTREANHRDTESLGASKSPNNVASMGAIWWGIRGTCPPTFSGGGDIICDVPPNFSLQVLYLEKFQKQK